MKNIALLLSFFCSSFFLKAQERTSCKSFSPQYAKAYHQQLKNNSLKKERHFKVEYYRLAIEVDPNYRYISGEVTSYFRTTHTLDTLIFDMKEGVYDKDSSIQVDSILYGSNKIQNYFRDKDELIIPLPHQLSTMTLDSINIFYSGEPIKNQGLGGFVKDNAKDTFPILWTLSEPYSSMEWWPCQNNINTKVDSIAIEITIPYGYKAIANGLLTKVDSTPNRQTYYWKHKYPITSYLVGFAVMDYQIVEDKIPLGKDSLFLQHYLYPNDSLSQRASTIQLPIFLNFFDSLLGTYPFIKEKYGHASFTNEGGGMEHQTISFMGNYGGELMAHELAHQWFGNKITPASWSDLWLSEGFATYMVLLTYEYGIVHDTSYFQKYLNNITATSLEVGKDGAVYREDTMNINSLFSPLVYEKAAAVIHTLRYNIGDEAFFSGIKSYLSDSSLAYGFAQTEDLRRYFEQASHRDLKSFFDAWIYQPGYPIFSIEWYSSSERLFFRIQQIQQNDSTIFFETAIPLQLIGEGIDTIISIEPNASFDLISIPFKGNIDTVIFNPKKQILAQAEIKVGLGKNKIPEEKIKLFPIPFTHWLNIMTEGIKIEDYVIYDVSGRVLLYGDYQEKLDLSSLKKGTYILELKNSEKVFRKKLIK